MNNFMYNVATNGIGGVNVGGVEHDVVPGRGQSMAFNDSKTYQYLTRNTDLISMYVKQGYLKPVKSLRMVVTTISERKAGYTVTPEGRDKFNGSQVVNDWMNEWKKEKEIASKERRILREIKMRTKEELLEMVL